jgi:septum site-determining protein MinC
MAGNLVQGALFTVMVVRAESLGDPAFDAELAEQIERSPRFFLNAPVVLDLKGADGFAAVDDFAAAQAALQQHTLCLVGVQNAAPAQAAAAAAIGLASFAPNAPQPARRQAVPAPAPPPPPPPRAPEPVGTRLITQPVRSGTQVYARGGDLVVAAAVGAGAEIVADGNIHVYGALRGRAIAGAAGNGEARIFCTRLEAELVSIAGRYLVSEQLPAEYHGAAVQIALVDDQLTITRN